MSITTWSFRNRIWASRRVDHAYPEQFAEQQHLPDSLKGRRFYNPGQLGYEKQVLDRLKAWWQNKGRPEAGEGPPEPGP